MNAAVVTGICVERDAISAAAVAQAAMLAGFDGIDEVTLIAHAHGREGAVRSLAVADSWELLRVLDRLDAELVIFHWGIQYDLFNALPAAAVGRRVAVHFHNVTPSHLVAADRRQLIEQSIRQMQLPALAGVAVWAVSGHNHDTLVDWGYPSESVRVVPIVATRPVPPRRPRAPGAPVRLLTVGRLVEAKGVDVLVESMRTVVARLPGRVSLLLAGGTEFSDRAYVEQLHDAIRRYGLEGSIRIEQDLDDAALAGEYAQADILVSPSRHEGLCVPVIEAYHAGLRVVGTDAGNLPYVVQPPDPVVPAGNPGALAEAIAAVAGEVLAGTSTPPPGATDLVLRYSPEGVRAELLDALNALGTAVTRA